MLVLLPLVPAVVAATALIQCGKTRELKKPGDRGGLSSKRSLPSRPAPRLNKSGPASRSKPRSAPSKRPSSSKKPSSTKSSKRSKERSALRSKSTKKPDGSTKTVKKEASGKLGKDKKNKEKSDKEQDKSKSEKQKDKKEKDKSKSERSTKISKSSKKDPKDKMDVSKSTKTAMSSFKAPAYKDVIEISVPELHWKPTGGLEKFFIQNKDKVSRAFKLKCSDNLLYRFSPVYGTVEPNGKFEVNVLRNNGASKIDKLVILTVQAPGDKKGEDRWKEVLVAGEPQAELAVVPLIASTA